MIKVIITKRDGKVSEVVCTSIHIKNYGIITNNDNDPIQILINLKNVEKVDIEGYEG